jgi:hypothetical protein
MLYIWILSPPGVSDRIQIYNIQSYQYKLWHIRGSKWETDRIQIYNIQSYQYKLWHTRGRKDPDIACIDKTECYISGSYQSLTYSPWCVTACIDKTECYISGSLLPLVCHSLYWSRYITFSLINTSCDTPGGVSERLIGSRYITFSLINTSCDTSGRVSERLIGSRYR